MKFCQTSHSFTHSWEKVSAGWWQKYPNENATHVLSVDVLSHQVDPHTGCIRTERLVACRQNVPTLIKKIFGAEDVSYAREIIEVDPKAKTFAVSSRNLSGSELLAMEEKVVYRPDPVDPTKTLLTQEAQFTALTRFSSYVEDFCVKRFRDNAHIGRQGFETVLNRLFAGNNAAAV
ncbi:MSF1-domain-containing protein [Basidiobolus meristosporus CBS 931.73]|uniref:MSF1-domain-containing protein n=1 Tax=Basidiobolus meristosporus CBS 931.73 TaxID=1314790 RepID=A0A1Y1YWF4_9FUNG|nr:MSF1-domain-containing protein [Basidiobolus meristosporus CBS 931.73]|eukprot:ORY02331.1 MSF1-domain-containing protein [Basidiobolus meristosporus CBS 931.73]